MTNHKGMNFKLTILSILLILLVAGCTPEKPKKVIEKGTLWEQDGNSITVTDAYITESFNDSDANVNMAPVNMNFIIVNVKVQLGQGNYNDLNSITVKRSEADATSDKLNESLTEKVNGKDIFQMKSKKVEEIKLVFLVDEGKSSIDGYNLNLRFGKDNLIEFSL